jgi:DNA-binding SARP family transcriptional activator/tetratricopeptide (TPR) repeat protein/DNA-binding XRE family transcriptional regulator
VSLGSLVRWRRHSAGLSQEEVATKAGLSVRTVRDIEQDRVTRPRAASLRALTRVLNLPDAELSAQVCAAPGTSAGLQEFRFSILGPLCVWHGQTAIGIPQAMQRALLSLFALKHGETVTRGQIVDALWGDKPPKTCESLVHDYVGRLRKLLEPGRRRWASARMLRSVAGGYLLEISVDQLDLARFDERAGAGMSALRNGRPEHAFDLLSEALRQWRGPILADCAEQLQRHPAAVAATQRLVTAALAGSDVALKLENHAWVADRLRPVLEQAPLHEGLHARLILALAGNGNQAAALSHYGNVRDRLAEELGVEPGEELKAAHLRVLRQDGLANQTRALLARTAIRDPWVTADPTRQILQLPQVTPAQLPPDIPRFTGRDDFLGWLSRLIHPNYAASDSGARIAVITGVAGVGKTALAVHWAHQVQHQFPDGQLYLNLRGYSADRPLPPFGALGQLLPALGLAPERIPADVEGAAALFRSLMTDKRMLLLLDNAYTAEQVRPLLSNSRHCVVIITSRSALTGLVARDGAESITLTEFSRREANAMLGALLARAQLRLDPSVATELGHLCGHLPLALRIAAAHLIQNPGYPVEAIIREMREGDRLSVLDVVGDQETGVRDIFALSYRALSEEEQLLFRMIALVPGPSVDASHAAVLMNTSKSHARQLLERLASEHLVLYVRHDSYSLHELLRLYATELSAELDSPAEHSDAMRRLYNYDNSMSAAAASVLYPHKTRLPRRGPSSDQPEDSAHCFTNEAEAVTWLDSHRDHLVSAIACAAEYRFEYSACTLADSLRGYFWLSMHTADWWIAAHSALDHALVSHDALAAASAHLSLGDLFSRVGENARAVRHYAWAASRARQSAWPEGLACALGSLGRLYRRTGRLARAARLLHAALRLEVVDEHSGAGVHATNLDALGLVYSTMGRLEEAVVSYRRALSLHRSSGSLTGEAVVLANLGETYHLMGKPKAARDLLTRALDLQRTLGDRGNESTTLYLLAAVVRDSGLPENALELGTMALDLARSTGYHGTEAGTLNLIASVHRALGSYPQALEYYKQAMDIARCISGHHAETVALLGIASAHIDHGAEDKSAEYITLALKISRQCGFGLLESQALKCQESRGGSPDPSDPSA